MLTSDQTWVPDDHIDLLMTAATRWGLVEDGTRWGRCLRVQNLAAIDGAAARGRGQLVARSAPVGTYLFREVGGLDLVEVIKATHSVVAMCEQSSDWDRSELQELLDAVSTSAIQRLPGYASAPWVWRRLSAVGQGCIGVVAGDDRPLEIPNVRWIRPEQARAYWDTPLILIRCSAAARLPADLPPRSGLFVLSVDEPHEVVWGAVVELAMPVLVAPWPESAGWLAEQLRGAGQRFSTLSGSALPTPRPGR
jgi:hypothetical protein